MFPTVAAELLTPQIAYMFSFNNIPISSRENSQSTTLRTSTVDLCCRNLHTKSPNCELRTSAVYLTVDLYCLSLSGRVTTSSIEHILPSTLLVVTCAQGGGGVGLRTRANGCAV